MGISIRAYARHRGVSDAAVRKAIAAGRITPEADGTIDAERVDRAHGIENTSVQRDPMARVLVGEGIGTDDPLAVEHDKVAPAEFF